MYLDYWHLNEKPFEKVMDFRFLFAASSHEECLARLSYAVMEKRGGAVLTGAAGIGKTTMRELLFRRVRDEGEGKRHVCTIIHPLLDIAGIIQECLYQFGVKDIATGKPELFRQFGAKMQDFGAKGEDILLAIDDAHMMSVEALQELKLLFNLQDDHQRQILTMVLVGESDHSAGPALLPKLAGVPGLRQRLSIVVPMPLLTQAEIGQYIQHRLKVAGGEGAVFTPAAVEEIHAFTQGNPRETNNVCDLALLIGFSERLASVDAELVKRVVEDVSSQFKLEAR